MDDDRIRIRYVKSRLYYRGADLKGSSIHLSMSKFYICIWYQLLNLRSKLLYIIYPVIYIIHLSLSRQLSGNSLPGKLFVVLHDICLYRSSVNRSLLKQAHIPYSNQAHVKSSRDRCGCECEDIHVSLHLFYLLFVIDAKSLLLIYDQESKIFKLNILGQKSVGSYHYVDFPLLEFSECILYLLLRTEST